MCPWMWNGRNLGLAWWSSVSWALFFSILHGEVNDTLIVQKRSKVFDAMLNTVDPPLSYGWQGPFINVLRNFIQFERDSRDKRVFSSTPLESAAWVWISIFFQFLSCMKRMNTWTGLDGWILFNTDVYLLSMSLCYLSNFLFRLLPDKMTEIFSLILAFPKTDVSYALHNVVYVWF